MVLFLPREICAVIRILSTALRDDFYCTYILRLAFSIIQFGKVGLMFSERKECFG